MTVGVFGEGVIDRFITEHEDQDVIGGSALNVAVALEKAGVDTNWCARVSLDVDGETIAQYAEDNRVASQRLLRRSEPTSVVGIHISTDGLPTYDFKLEGAVDWQWTKQELKTALSELPVLQLSSLSCVLSPGADVLPEVLDELKTVQPSLVICFDPNARPRAAKSDSHANEMRQRIEALVRLSDLVKVSDEDLEWLSPGITPEEKAQQWSSCGPQLVVLTQGARGAHAYADGRLLCAVRGVETEVVDTVGAGDTFMAWLLRSIVEDHHNTIPTAIDDVSAMLKQSARAAAITCSRKGCKPPLRSEVL